MPGLFRGLVPWAVMAPLLAGAPVVVAQETPYRVDLTGIDDEELRSLLQSASTLFRLSQEPPPSLIGLERRAEADRERLETALRSAGFYDGSVTIAIDADATPVGVIVTVEPGPAYRFAAVTLQTPEGQPLVGEPIPPAEIGLEPGQRARAPAVVAAQDRIAARLAQRGYAFARVSDRRVVVDHDQRAMEVTYTVQPGPLVRLDGTRLDGLERVDAGVVRGRLPWKPGEVFAPSLLDEARTRISQLGVFESVRVQLAEPTPEMLEAQEVRAPVIIATTERKRRFIGAGVNVSTQEGFGATAYWGHRNLFGGAEQLTIAAEIRRVGETDPLERTDLQLSADFRKPDFLLTDQTLILSALAVTEAPPAYERDAVAAVARLERVLAEGFTVSYGVSLEQERVRENGRVTDSTLLGFPLAAVHDATDDLLNPARGYRVAVEGTPYFQAGDRGNAFLPSRVTNSAYYDIAGDGKYVAAGRLSLGAIFGDSIRDIPADKRFYAGGGG
ncbi:MAG TPA: POTRA domain-containing protein, partial [Azospirillaceae bacterium]|nr:POTRA domain-containing protein [Azospirillaceae bacterium]